MQPLLGLVEPHAHLPEPATFFLIMGALLLCFVIWQYESRSGS